MVENIFSFAVLFILALATAIVVYLLIHKSLRALLDETIRLPSGTTFYARIFLIGLIFIALSAALKTGFNLDEESAFMEYVWRIADGLSSTFGNICLFLVGYLLLVTILVAVLRRKRG